MGCRLAQSHPGAGAIPGRRGSACRAGESRQTTRSGGLGEIRCILTVRCLRGAKTNCSVSLGFNVGNGGRGEVREGPSCGQRFPGSGSEGRISGNVRMREWSPSAPLDPRIFKWSPSAPFGNGSCGVSTSRMRFRKRMDLDVMFSCALRRNGIRPAIKGREN